MENVVEKIVDLISPLLEREKMVLVDLNMHKGNRKIDLKFLIDRCNGGITLDECSNINYKIGKLIEDENIIQEHYVLEVSSPGLKRPLFNVSDFKRAINKEAHFFLKDAIEDKLELNGKILTVDEACVSVLVEEKEIKIPVDTIEKAKQII